MMNEWEDYLKGQLSEMESAQTRVALIGYVLGVFLASLIVLGVVWVGYANAEEYTDQEVCSAIKKSENSKSHPYGILRPYCTEHTEDKCLKGCLQTVQHNRNRFQKSNAKDQDFIRYLAGVYCPISSDTDNGTCKFWEGNVRYFLEKDS